MKISEAFDMYINEYMCLSGRSDRCISHFEQHKRFLVAFLGDKDISDVSLKDLAEWKKWLMQGRSLNTVRNYIGSVRTVFGYARQKGIACIERESIPVPKREPVTMPFVTPDEVQMMINVTDSIRDKFIISFLYASGVRLSELISLDIAQIEDMQFSVVGKGKRKRLCFIDKRTDDLMRQYLATRCDNSPALIVQRFGQRPSPSNIQKMVRDSVKKAKIQKKITPHSFRHGYATNMIRNGADIRYVAQSLGHANLSTTMIYTHIMNPDMREKYILYHTI